MLYWLQKRPSVLIPSCANRVERIQGFGFPFYHVTTDENPADICSRSCKVKELKSDKWNKGPTWLKNPMSSWPKQKMDWSRIDKNEGAKKQHVNAFVAHVNTCFDIFSHKCVNGDVVSYDKYYGDHQQLLKKSASTIFL